jgi:hypothetical protein
VRVPKLVGKYKQVRVSIVGALFFNAEGAQSIKLADDNFGLFILDEIFSRQSILTRLRGLLRKTHHCRQCDADLSGLKAHRRRFALSIQYKQLPTFKVEMPAIPCRSCGTSNAVNEENTRYIVSGAVAVAFESLKTRRQSALSGK